MWRLLFTYTSFLSTNRSWKCSLPSIFFKLIFKQLPKIQCKLIFSYIVLNFHQLMGNWNILVKKSYSLKSIRSANVTARSKRRFVSSIQLCVNAFAWTGSIFQDCHLLQVFKESECRCICANKDEERKCYENHNKKLWNPDVCACQCRDIQHCTTGYTFDTNTCRCVSPPLRRRYVDSEQERSAYISSVPEILPLFASDDD